MKVLFSADAWADYLGWQAQEPTSGWKSRPAADITGVFPVYFDARSVPSFAQRRP